MSRITRVNRILVAALAVLALATQAPAASLERFRSHIEALTANGGVWVASNSRYKSDTEPFDAYKLIWRQGIGGRSMVGRMTALRGLEESGPIWEFRVYWDPETDQVRILQFGASGFLGVGTVELTANGEEESIQTFYPPRDDTYQVRHTAKLHGDVHETVSYRRSGESWERNRSYTWVRRGAVAE